MLGKPRGRRPSRAIKIDRGSPPRGRVLGLALCASAFALLLVVAPSGAFHGSKVYVAGHADSSSPRYKPKRVWLSGDSTLYVNRIHWRAYNGYVAKARGVGHINDCNPDCADGHFHRHRLALRLKRPRRPCGRYFYSRVRITWAGHPPFGG